MEIEKSKIEIDLLNLNVSLLLYGFCPSLFRFIINNDILLIIAFWCKFFNRIKNKRIENKNNNNKNKIDMVTDYQIHRTESY